MFIEIAVSTCIGLLGWVLAKVNTMAREMHDLHVWHAPDTDGRQIWKSDNSKLLIKLDILIDKLNDVLTQRHEPQG